MLRIGPGKVFATGLVLLLLIRTAPPVLTLRMQSGEGSPSLALFSTAIATQLHPDDGSTWFWYGAARVDGDPEGAIVAWERAESLGVDPYRTQLQIAYMRQRERNVDAAVSAWAKVNELTPAFLWEQERLGNGDAETSLSIVYAIYRYAKLPDDRSRAAHLIGQSKAQLGDWKSALPYLKEAVTLSPDGILFQVDYARALIFTGGSRELAKEHIARAEAIDSSNRWMAAVLADAYHTVSDVDSAAYWDQRR